MDFFDLGEVALRVAPRRISQAAVLAVAIGLWANAGWATSLVTVIVDHCVDVVVGAVQDSVRDSLPAAPPPAPEKG